MYLAKTLPQPAQPQQSNYQTALDYAEMQRNLLNSLTSAHANQVYGGPQGTASLNDVSHVQLPQGMPDAYGLLGTTRGAQHEEFDDPQGAQAFLARARQFDPNAQLTYGEGNGSGQYYIDWDNSKLPQPVVPQNGHMTNFGGYNQSDLFNQNMTVNDPHFGVLTDNRNIKQPKPDWLDQLGNYAPLIIGGLATMGAGLPLFGAMSNPALLGSRLLQGGLSMARGVGGGQGINPIALLQLGRYFMGGGSGG